MRQFSQLEYGKKEELTVPIKQPDEMQAAGPEIGRVLVLESKNSMSEAFLRLSCSSRAQSVAIERE